MILDQLRVIGIQITQRSKLVNFDTREIQIQIQKSFLISNDHTTSPVCREHVSISNLGVSSNYTSNVITVLEY